MDWIRWISLLQPIILSVALVIFRPQWIGLQKETIGEAPTYVDSSADVNDIQEKLKYLEENTVSSKNLDGLEDSISNIYKTIGELQEQTQKYSKQQGMADSSHDLVYPNDKFDTGRLTSIGLAVLATIQLAVVVCVILLWRKILSLQAAQSGPAENAKHANNLKTPAT